jgi:hypothetical protein
MIDYQAIPALAHYVLEESYVLEVIESPGQVTLRTDFAFASDHPDLLPARTGEWTYYREGIIRFQGVEKFEWLDRKPPTRDADDTLSWNLDGLTQDGRQFELEGDFGSIIIVAGSVESEITGPA